MNCKIDQVLNTLPFYHAFRIMDTTTGNFVWMPGPQAFEHIRFRMDPLEGHNNRIEDAYKSAGESYAKLIPESSILPCIKRIYTNYHVLNESGVQVFQPFGDWVFEEACKCLQQQTSSGRFDLGDGFIVPSESEWNCIINAMFNNGKSLASALTLCTPDIDFPRTIIKFLEDAINANTEMGYPRYNIIRVAHSAWMVSNKTNPRITIANGLVVPSSEEIYKIEYAMFEYNRTLANAYTINGWSDILPPIDTLDCIEGKIRNTSDDWVTIFNSCPSNLLIPKPEKKNTLLYVALGVGALLYFTRKA